MKVNVINKGKFKAIMNDEAKISKIINHEMIINEGNKQMLHKIKPPAVPHRSVNLEQVNNTYNYKRAKKYSEDGDLKKICFYSHCDRDPRTYMNWGDYWVKKQLQYSFAKLFGDKIRVVDNKSEADIVVYQFGSPYTNVDSKQINIIWFYSHPEKMTTKELSKYDYMFCASHKFLKKIMRNWDKWKDLGCIINLKPLYACTNFKFINKSEVDKDILFVGNARSGKVYGRKSIYDLSSVSKTSWSVHLYGAKWELSKYQFSHKWYKGKYIPYDELPIMYASAKINLIDGHEEMQDQGFVSAKVFDTIAAGGQVIMEYNSGIEEIFGDDIKMYKNQLEMWKLINETLEKTESDTKQLKKLSKIAQKYSYDSVAKEMYSEIHKEFLTPKRKKKKRYGQKIQTES